MARNFRRPRSSHPIAELNVTNLIDLGFMLLIIFMIVANPTLQKEQTIPVNLPSVSKLPEPPADTRDQFISLGVDAAGRFYVGENKTTVSPMELQSKLHGYAAMSHQPIIRIRGDARVPYEKVAQLMAELQRAGLTKITFDSQSNE
ncbi:MAG TPA: biopolymer transporter ExbD [Opitutaceae bacterium]|nr:biopolymer transporter ExbD [Opitutaceae bacterium]